MKTLVSCKPSEFLVQTNKIRKAVSKWLTDTNITGIRKTKPVLIPVNDNLSLEEKEEAIIENRRRLRAQSQENLTRILDAILEEHPQETLELLGLLCFIDPENVDDYSVADYLTAASEIIGNEAVLDFFTSLMRLDQMNTSDTVNQ